MDLKFFALFPKLTAVRQASGLSLRERPLVHLAPMVRAGSLPLRELCLEYGADLVWSEEIIDRKLTLTQRRVNTALGTVDYVVPSQQNRAETLLFRTAPLEEGRIVLQLGTATPEGAVAAALHVAADVAAIDVNMGCPKSFSVQNGMGAALLKDQDRACAIVSALKAALPAGMPVTVKVRLLETREATLALLRRLEAAGADAITVHLRQASTGEGQPALGWEELAALTTEMPNTPLLVNGDMYSLHRVREMVRLSGCAGAILARPILLNASCLRQEGPLPQLQVMQAFVRKCLRWDLIYQLAKYTLMEMMVLRRHPTAVLQALKAEPGGIPEHGKKTALWEPVQAAKSLLQVCAAFGMQAEYHARYGGCKEGVLSKAIATTAAAAVKEGSGKRLREPSSVATVHRLDDGYFAETEPVEAEAAANPTKHPRLRPATAAAAPLAASSVSMDYTGEAEESKMHEGAAVEANGSTVMFRLGRPADAAAILAISNDAYKADEFFKLPAYYLRFTLQDIRAMLAGKGHFLVACVPGAAAKGEVVACLYIDREVTVTEAAVHCKGEFMAVAVGQRFDRRGIGSALIRATERLVLQTAVDAEAEAPAAAAAAAAVAVPRTVTAEIGMGVLNVRPDLFLWYTKQGFVRGEEIRPASAEITRISLPGFDVCCVNMSKTLQ